MLATSDPEFAWVELGHDEDGYDSDSERLGRMTTNVTVSSRPWRSEMQRQIDSGCDIWSLEVGAHLVRYRDGTWPPDRNDCRIRSTGKRVWDAALVLAKFFENEQYFPAGFWADKRVLELGAGLGVPSLAVGLLGAREVALTDIEDGLPLLRENIRLNGLADKDAYACTLEWGTDIRAEGTDSRLHAPFDVVLMSDVLYCNDALAPLAETVHAITRPGSLVISCCEHRWPEAAAFYGMLESRGFECTRISRRYAHRVRRR